MKVLFDNSVRSDAVRAHIYAELRQGEGLGRRYTYLHPVSRPRPQRRDWRQREIDCLPQIAELVSDGEISPFTTSELEAELFRALRFPSNVQEDILAGVRYGYLPPPLDRSKWGLSVEQYLGKDDVIRFCESFFLSPKDDGIERFIKGMKQNPRFVLSDFEERCLRRIATFRAICRGIDRTHYPDALHLWTAEENGVDVFLTLDRRFRNVVNRQRVNLHCKTLFPSDLLRVMTSTA